MTLARFARCSRESHGVWPKAQAHIPSHGTLGQRIFHLKSQAHAHSFHGLFGTIVAWGPPHHGCHGVGRKWPQGIKVSGVFGCGNLPRHLQHDKRGGYREHVHHRLLSQKNFIVAYPKP